MPAKVTKTKQPEFHPVVLTIEITNQKELDFWGSLFNNSNFCGFLKAQTGSTDYENTWEDLQQAGANFGSSISTELHKALNKLPFKL